jgi:hypothetical protein
MSFFRGTGGGTRFLRAFFRMRAGPVRWLGFCGRPFLTLSPGICYKIGPLY